MEEHNTLAPKVVREMWRILKPGKPWVSISFTDEFKYKKYFWKARDLYDVHFDHEFYHISNGRWVWINYKV
eukprot:CAMPEP_0116921332 /NCGR_PEP_ID=MMETSP0467-20121206/21566_1 /TAXON_ID=283647 /ORGANISM="Mesodinium pulex, Strain SPMC105" /LENGTH=70 /DNA_ID=CAMNT_0004599377 /DNA_START=784 /DNA_END=996 /DNA_ORIENTATION=-